MTKFDILQAKFKHLNWKFRIRLFLDGQQTISNEQATDHTQCELGKWYYSKGKQMYGNIPEMLEFENEHIKLHKLVNEIINLNKNEERDKAEEKYNELLIISEKIVSLFNFIENIVD